MRTLTTAVATILGLSLVLPAQAAETKAGEMVQNAHHMHFLGKRAYQSPVIAKADADQAWVGATLRVEQSSQQQSMRMHALGKRAF